MQNGHIGFLLCPHLLDSRHRPLSAGLGIPANPFMHRGPALVHPSPLLVRNEAERGVLERDQVPPSTSLSRYCTFETIGKDANNGPANSSSVGRLMACTFAQKCPLPSPRSRYHLPPGHGSIFIFRDLPSGVSLPGPSCSSSAAKVVSRGAFNVDLLVNRNGQVFKCQVGRNHDFSLAFESGEFNSVEPSRTIASARSFTRFN